MKKPPQTRRLFSVNRFEYIVNNVGVATGTPTALQFAAGNPYCGTNCALRAMGVPPPPYPPPYPPLPPNNHLGLFSTVGRGLLPPFSRGTGSSRAPTHTARGSLRLSTCGRGTGGLGVHEGWATPKFVAQRLRHYSLLPLYFSPCVGYTAEVLSAGTIFAVFTVCGCACGVAGRGSDGI